MNQNKVKNPAAVALGKLGAGHPKNYSKEELAKRTARLKSLKKTIKSALIVCLLFAANLKADVVERAGYFISDLDLPKITDSAAINPVPATTPAVIPIQTQLNPAVATIVQIVFCILGAVALILLLAISLGFYFLPAILGRKKHNCRAILILNLCTGWSFIGWVASLIWACTKDPKIATVLN
jgi:Superinfection immunity protein